MFDYEAIAKKIEWFSENYSQEIYAVPAPYDMSKSRHGSLHFKLPLSGSLGIFTDIFKDAYLAVSATEHNDMSDMGEKLTLIAVTVGLHYSTVANDASYGHTLVDLWFDGEDGSLTEYIFPGKDLVVL